jgi:hypothetical protein
MNHIKQNGIYLHPVCLAYYKDFEHVTAHVKYNTNMKYIVYTTAQSHVVRKPCTDQNRCNMLTNCMEQLRS